MQSKCISASPHTPNVLLHTHKDPWALTCPPNSSGPNSITHSCKQRLAIEGIHCQCPGARYRMTPRQNPLSFYKLLCNCGHILHVVLFPFYQDFVLGMLCVQLFTTVSHLRSCIPYENNPCMPYTLLYAFPPFRINVKITREQQGKEQQKRDRPSKGCSLYETPINGHMCGIKGTVVLALHRLHTITRRLVIKCDDCNVTII